MKKFLPYYLFICFLLLAAHVMRVHGLLAALPLAGFAALGFTRRASWRLLACLGCLLGALTFAQAGVEFITFRMAFNTPWLRLALILGLVVAAMLYGLHLLLGRYGQESFTHHRETAWPEAAAFTLSATGLLAAKAKASIPLLLADRFWPGSGYCEIFLLSLYAAWLCAKLIAARQTARLRLNLWAGFSLVFFLQLLIGLCGFESFLMTGKLHLPVPALIAAGPLYRGEGFFMPILFGVTLLLAGPAWCSHLCYIGAWDGLASQARKRPERLDPKLNYLRLGTLLFCLCAALGLRFSGAPTWLAALSAAIFGLAGVFIMLAYSRRKGLMLHCLTFCPIGILSNTLGRISPWRMRISEDCTLCGRCSRVCRYAALSPFDLKAQKPGLTCTLCGDCVGACEQQSIGYRLARLSPAQSRAAFITLITALHAIFLGVARI